jgi:nicotinamide-nucleotide amidase
MLLESSLQLFKCLLNTKNSVVFCESCTAGLAAASLGRFPGASKALTGAIVVYQTATKHDWLQLDNAILEAPDIGPVSEPVTRLLAEQVLRRSSTSTIAAAITGHLGPSSSIADYDSVRLGIQSSSQASDNDGTVFVAIATKKKTLCRQFQLRSPSPASHEDHEARYKRQQEATVLLFQTLLQFLTDNDPQAFDLR